jgi:aromatic ring-opening dioxygenase catalytic subunit (LigB family)
MGEIVGVGLLAHVPTIMLEEQTRRSLNHGNDTTLVDGLERLRNEVFEAPDYDTVLVVDSHWATTVEFVVASQALRAGLHTSSELPRGMCRIPYDFPGDPELAQTIASLGEDAGTWITAIDDPYLPLYYGTLNLWSYLGVEGRAWVSVSVCQTGQPDDFLTFGEVIGRAVEKIDRRVLVVGSGAMSHTFWPLQQIREHEAAGVEHIFTPEAAAADFERIEWLEAGRHREVISTMASYARFRPEARFAHYLTMVGAVGGERCGARAHRYSEYENSVGTGQIHLWFPRPKEGWTS